jgi:glycosyltransferase involved in cell wall biosynthesis
MLKANPAPALAVKNDMKNSVDHRANNHDPRISILEIIGTATRGGMENYLVNFFKNLPADEFRISCICPCESQFTKTLRTLGIEDIFITPLADNPEWRSIQMAIAVCRLNHVDLLHAHMPKSHVLAGIAGALINKPVVATVHGMHLNAHELGVTLAVGSHLIANCQETYVQALTLGVPPYRVNLYHNGVDIAVFTPAKSGKKLRDLVNVSATTTLIGFVGRLEHEKGPDLFVRAAANVHNIFPDAHFVIVGAGSMLAELERMSKQLGIGENLHLVDWTEDPSEIYPGLDLLVHCSRSDGTSLVLLEAMACGLPVVGIAVGGVREVIENEHTGVVVDANDWERLGFEIMELLKQPTLLKTMGAAARKRVEENFNVLTNTCKTAGLLREIARSANKSQPPADNYNVFQNGNGNGLSKKIHYSKQ